LQKFIDSGFNPNELIVVLLRQARWQLVAVYLWCKGYSWQEIPAKLMKMGKVPALIWHSSKLADDIKEREGERYKDMDLFCNYLVEKCGLPRNYIKPSDKKNKAETLPHPIIAEQIVGFLENKVIASNQAKDEIEMKKKMLNRALVVYTFISDKLEQVRYNADNAIQDLHEAVRVITNTKFDNF
jgi:hypothetical protein